MDVALEGKSALVTGSSFGIGEVIARILASPKIKDRGVLIGRILLETMPGDKTPRYIAKVLRSEPAAGGISTVVIYELVGNTRYFDAAGFPGRTLGLAETNIPAAIARS